MDRIMHGLIALALGLLAAISGAAPAPLIPGARWEKIDAALRGWSAAQLSQANALARKAGSAGLLVVHQGRIVSDWGNTARRYNVHSIRKSLLSALIGIYVTSGSMRLSDTLQELGIDDNEPRLTAVEKRATVGDLLRARSGVYHPALYETAGMKAARPVRGSHAPGAFFYYNNWDFNALGTIFERAAGLSLFEAFKRHIADPLQMEDFRLADTEYVRGADSLHPAYPFSMSARDMARFGLLYLHHGRWGERQLVPADWVAQSTRSCSVSVTTSGLAHSGYGCMWWTDWQGRHLENVALPPGAYSARGAGGHYILVVPGLDLVIVNRVANDDAGGPTVDRNEFGAVVNLILHAMPPGARPQPPPARPVDSLPRALDQLVPQLMALYHVPGVAVTGIENRRVAWERGYGVKRAGRPETVDPTTIFEAASMSKLLLAHTALKLAEQRRLDLDKSLAEYLPDPYLPDEPRHRLITARMVLSHTTGFPNWRAGGWQKGGPLPLLRDPGTRFGYSGEGFLYLQRVVEHLTGAPLDPWLKTSLLEPLGMSESSLVWLDRYASQAAAGHNAKGEPLPSRNLYHDANAAYSLYCTASDYARFMIEFMPADHSAPHSLSADSLKAMFTRTTLVEGRKPVQRRGGPRSEPVYYGLGWVIETAGDGDRYSHGGSNGTGFRSYCEFNPRRGNGLVIMTNATNGDKLWRAVLAAAGEP